MEEREERKASFIKGVFTNDEEDEAAYRAAAMQQEQWRKLLYPQARRREIIDKTLRPLRNRRGRYVKRNIK